MTDPFLRHDVSFDDFQFDQPLVAVFWQVNFHMALMLIMTQLIENFLSDYWRKSYKTDFNADYKVTSTQFITKPILLTIQILYLTDKIKYNKNELVNKN